MKKIIISLLLFVFVFVLLTIPYTGWWFNGCDDFRGLYQGYCAKTWSDLFYFFCDGHIGQGIGPSNYLDAAPNAPTGFFSTYYRPIYLVCLTLQYWVFGTNAYGYFLCNVFFHALNSTLLFLIFSSITTVLPALLGALFFAFHPQVAYRFGAIVNLHYYINVFLILLTLIFFKKYLDVKKTRFYLLACLTFTTALFTRESCIVLPAIIFLMTWAYQQKPITHVLKTTLGFFVIAGAFLGLRMYLYPIAEHAGSHTTISNFLFAKKQELLVCLYDCFGLSWLPWGHKIMRGTLLGTLLLLAAWLFIKNRQKIWILVLCISAFLMLWPGLVGCYSPRYMYEALPFIIGAFIFLFQGYQGSLTKYKNIPLLLISGLIVFCILLTRQSFFLREQKMQTNAHAIQDLITNPLTKNRAICFLSYPMDGLGDQPSDIVRVMRDSISLPVFCDTATALVQEGANIVVPKKWYNAVSPYYIKNYVSITPVDGGFRYRSSDATKIHFLLPEQQTYSLGRKIINQYAHIGDRKVVTDFTLLIDSMVTDKEIVFATWDYELKGFKVSY